MADSAYSHPYQASAEGQKTRTYATAESRDRHAQQWADEIQQIVNVWEHSRDDGWGLVGRVEPTKPADVEPEEDGLEVEGSWPCKEPDCRAPVEANPSLFMSLNSDGRWEISGIGDDGAIVACQQGHSQNDAELKKSLSGFLEKVLPGNTWAGATNAIIHALPCGCVPHAVRMRDNSLGQPLWCDTEQQAYCNFECPHADAED